MVGCPHHTNVCKILWLFGAISLLSLDILSFNLVSYTVPYCFGASEQQHNQDLREIYKVGQILKFITIYQNAWHLTRLHCATSNLNNMRKTWGSLVGESMHHSLLRLRVFFVANFLKHSYRSYQGFVRVLKTLENLWISGVRFQGLESTWISISVLESPWVFIEQDRKCFALSVNPKHRC